MSNIVLKVDNLSKQYRLGLVGTGTLSHDLNRWWHLARGREDPYLKIGEENDRSVQSGNKYVWALKDISFEVNEGEVLGIIGKNGAGKSTLLKILSRVTGPSTGTIKAKGRIASLLEVGTGFHPELTGKENIYLNGTILGMTRSEVTAKLDEIVEFSGVSKYLDTPVKRYSSGMMVRLGFAVAAHLEPEILIVDEVLAVGDFEFQEKCIGKMKDVSRGGRTVLFVSHNMASIKALCGRGILLKNGKISYEGEIDKVVDQYLVGETGSANTGIYIDEDYDYYNGKAKIISAQINDILPQNEKQIYYKDSFKLKLKIRVEEPIKDAAVAVSIDLRDSTKVLYACTIDEGHDKLMKLTKGEHEIELTVDSLMLPGAYSFTFNLMHRNGDAICYIERALDFNVLRISRAKNEDYKWTKSNALAMLSGSWKLNS